MKKKVRPRKEYKPIKVFEAPTVQCSDTFVGYCMLDSVSKKRSKSRIDGGRRI
jgi:hypothetical protein